MPGTSPNDPVFFLHHANVDRLWYMWQRKYFQNDISNSYIPVTGGPSGHNLNDPMFPWKSTPNSVLDPPNQLGYTYDKCFIATAALGSELSGPVRMLREFRDKTLMRSRYAPEFKDILRVYYRFAPHVAEKMEQDEFSRQIVKYLVAWPAVIVITACVAVMERFFATPKREDIGVTRNGTMRNRE